MHTNTNTQEKTGAQMAAEYAEGIAEDVATLDLLCEHIDEVAELADTADGVDVLAELVGITAEEVAPLLSLFRDLGEPASASEAVSEWIGQQLDVTLTGEFSGGEWTVTGGAVLVTAGGPTCRVVWDGRRRGALVIECSWWSETVTRYAACTALVDWFGEYADTVG